MPAVTPRLLNLESNALTTKLQCLPLNGVKKYVTWWPVCLMQLTSIHFLSSVYHTETLSSSVWPMCLCWNFVSNNQWRKYWHKDGICHQWTREKSCKFCVFTCEANRNNVQSTLALWTPRYYGQNPALYPAKAIEAWLNMTPAIVDSHHYGLQTTSWGCPL